MAEVILEGLDGGTPLGFLAGLGAQRVLVGRGSVDLSWRQLDAWRPVLHGVESIEDVADAVVADAAGWEAAPILGFRYLKLEKNGPKAFAGLRAPVAVLRQWLLERRTVGDEASLAVACALMCEAVAEEIVEHATADQLAAEGIAAAADAPLDRATLPTFFDFTSRNAQFLDQVAVIRAHLNREVILAGLVRGEPDPSAPRSMDWDPAADTPGAIYTGYSRGFLPVAEWLAFRGLICFPLAGAGPTLVTTGCSGRRKDGELVWPLWDVPASASVVQSLVGYPALDRMTANERRALGIAAVRRAGLTKKADGYSGMFSPSRPA